MAIRKYEVQQTDWLDGVHRTKGESVDMDEDAAKYLVLNGQLKLKEDAARKPAPTADKTKKAQSAATATPKES